MDNPLKLARPTDPIQQIHEYARDLAYLFATGNIGPTISTGGRFSWSDSPYVERDNDSQNRIDFRAKWVTKSDENFSPPAFELLAAYEYLSVASKEHDINNRTITNYVLTPKALQLLEKPVQAPSVFISYSRKDSSAFALLIEARLRIAGAPEVFIDKKITAGDEWAEHLQERIREARYFICLVGPNTLNSSVVRQEVEWAAQAGCRIISIWHGGAKITDSAPQALQKRHAISVSGESAREYETAISELLNSMGYRTY
jgi:hypothetical protein